MAPVYCPVCTTKYSSKYSSTNALLDHLVSVHPTADETIERTNRVRTSTYGLSEVGKVKPPEVQ